MAIFICYSMSSMISLKWEKCISIYGADTKFSVLENGNRL